MSLKAFLFNAAGVTQGTALAASGANTGASFIVTNGGTAIFDTASAFNGGTYGGKFTSAGSTTQCLGRWLPNAANAAMGIGFGFIYYALPAAELTIATMRTTGVAASINLDTSGRLKVYDAANVTGTGTLISTTGLTTGVKYELRGYFVAGTSATNGSYVLNLYAENGTSPLYSSSNNAYNLGTSPSITGFDIGVVTPMAAATVISVDSIQLHDGSRAVPAPIAVPTASFGYTTSALTASFDGTNSASHITDAVITGYDWDFGDGSTHGTGPTPTHTYASSSTTYTAVLTVTDTSGLTATTSQSISLAGSGSTTVVPVSIVSAPGFTAVGAADVVTAVSDNNQASFAISIVGPLVNQIFRVRLGPHSVPTPGTDQQVTVEVDMTGATTGTVSAKEYEGSTLRSSAAAQNLSNVASGTNTVTVLSFIFPAADIVNITPNGWLGLDVEFTVNAS